MAPPTPLASWWEAADDPVSLDQPADLGYDAKKPLPNLGGTLVSRWRSLLPAGTLGSLCQQTCQGRRSIHGCRRGEYGTNIRMPLLAGPARCWGRFVGFARVGPFSLTLGVVVNSQGKNYSYPKTKC